jgi:hypothetical protein
MNVEIGAEAAQFSEKEYINGIAVAVLARKHEVVDLFFSHLQKGTLFTKAWAVMCFRISNVQTFHWSTSCKTTGKLKLRY